MAGDVVLVLGGTGWVGSVLVPALRGRGYDVLAPGRATLDLHSTSRLTQYIESAQPRAVVNVAAANPGASIEEFEPINVHAAEVAAQAAHRVGARLVHVASDAGLDGRDAPYVDDAPMRPVYPYGASKAEGETRVLDAHPDAVSVRTSLLWDPTTMDRGTAGFAARLAKGESLSLFDDEIRCPLPRATLASCLVDLIETPHAGPLNVAGREALSRLEFGRLLLAHFDVAGRERIEVVSSAELQAGGAPPRPLDLTLDVTLAEALLRRRLAGVREVLGAP